MTDHYPAIISKDQFDKVQAEKARRSNLVTTEASSQREATKYNSGNVLSGLLICAECGSSYRRITRSGGAVIWCCVNSVEHGKTYCKDSATIVDTAAKEFLCQTMNMADFDEQIVQTHVESVLAEDDGKLSIFYKQESSMTMTL